MHSATVLLNDQMMLLFSLKSHSFCGWNQPHGALRARLFLRGHSSIAYSYHSLSKEKSRSTATRGITPQKRRGGGRTPSGSRTPFFGYSKGLPDIPIPGKDTTCR